MRVINTLRAWGVYVDEAFFLGGVGKAKVLTGFNPHIFFDDQDVHLEAAANLVPSGKVPYLTKSGLSGLLPAPAEWTCRARSRDAGCLGELAETSDANRSCGS